MYLGPPDGKQSAYGHGIWWQAKKGESHDALIQTARTLRRDDQLRRDDHLKHARLYGAKQIFGLSARKYHQSRLGDRIALNICKSAVNTFVSKVVKNEPKATVLTNGGNYTLQQRAKRLDKFVEGVSYVANMEGVRIDRVRDSAVWGTGVTKFLRDEHGRIWAERVYPWELMVDAAEALYGDPRCYYQSYYVDRHVLAGMFRGDAKRAAILAATEVDPDDARDSTDTNTSMVWVHEAWCIPTDQRKKDGRHVIAIEGCTLKDEPYSRATPPFVFLHYERPLMGFWGSGVVEELTGIQVEINMILRDIQERFHVGSKPWLLTPRSARIKREAFKNTLFNRIDFDGVDRPTIEVFATTHPEVFAHLNGLIERAFQIVGISQLSAGSQKPAGLNSGRALMEFHDIESERFAEYGKRVDRAVVEDAKQFIALARDVDEAATAARKRGEEADPLEVQTIYRRRRRSFLKTLKWSDVSMDDDAFELKVYPSSALPHNPAGRTATVESWIAAGFIDQTTGMHLLDFPDLEQHTSLNLAVFEVVLDQIEMMLEEGEYVAPEPYQDLQLTMKLATAAYLRARTDGAPDERLSLLRDYIDSAEALAAPPEQTAPGGAGTVAPAPDQAGAAPPPAMGVAA